MSSERIGGDGCEKDEADHCSAHPYEEPSYGVIRMEDF